MLTKVCFVAILLMSVSAEAQSFRQNASLIVAVQDGKVEQVQNLLRNRANADARDDVGISALSWAVLRNDTRLVDMLIRAGANPNLADANGIAPLLPAVEMETADVVSALLRAGANPNAARPNGETALMIAARTGAANIARILLDAGADPNRAESRFNQTALMRAAGHPDVTRLLLSRRARTDAVTKTWDIPATNYTPVVSTLGLTGIPWNNSGDYSGKAGGYNALLFAAQQGDLESAKMLLDAGMDANFVSADGTSPLLAALYRWIPGPPQKAGSVTQVEGDSERIELRPNVQLANLLLDRGAKPNVSDRAGYSPLHAIVLRFVHFDPRGRALIGYNANKPSKLVEPTGRTENDGEALALIQRLLDLGANPNKQTTANTPGPVGVIKMNPAPPGSSPLHIAAATHNVAVVNLLLSRQADPNLVREDGHTPFSLAVVLNDLGVVQAMAEKGADIQKVYNPDDKIPDPVLSKAEQHAKQTIMHLAGVANAYSVIEYLASKGAITDAKNGLEMTPYDEADGQERFRYAHDLEGGGLGRGKADIVRNTLTTDAFKKLGLSGAKVAGK